MADIFLIREAIAAAKLDAELEIVRDGHQATNLIDQVEAGQAPRPDLVLLDLNLPKKSGDDVLKRLGACIPCANVSVLIITSSDSADDRRTTKALGAAGFFRKPSEYEEYMRLGVIVKDLLGGC